MPKPRLRFLHREVSRHGRATWYFRRGHAPRVKLPDVFESPGFMAAYFVALRESGWTMPDEPLPRERREPAIMRRPGAELKGRLAVEAEGPAVSGSVVYFMRAGDRVKIGFSKNPRMRAASMQTAVPERIEIVCTIKGGAALERKFHRKFIAERIGGEWFAYRGSLAEFLTGRTEPDFRL